MAQSLDIALGLPIEVETANGKLIARRSSLRSVRIGRVIVREVAAIVHPDSSCHEALVGMSFLKRLRTLVIRGDTLLLVGNNATRKNKSAR